MSGSSNDYNNLEESSKSEYECSESNSDNEESKDMSPINDRNLSEETVVLFSSNNQNLNNNNIESSNYTTTSNSKSNILLI